LSTLSRPSIVLKADCLSPPSRGLAAYTLTPGAPTFINDVVLTANAAYFTESNRPVVYRVPLGPGGSVPTQAEVEALPLTGDWQQVAGFNANGIEATPDGGALIIVNTRTCLSVLT
jgi:hypothetical protein